LALYVFKVSLEHLETAFLCINEENFILKILGWILSFLIKERHHVYDADKSLLKALGHLLCPMHVVFALVMNYLSIRYFARIMTLGSLRLLDLFILILIADLLLLVLIFINGRARTYRLRRDLLLLLRRILW